MTQYDSNYISNYMSCSDAVNFKRERGLIGSIGFADLTVPKLNHVVRFSKLDILQISPFNYDELHEAGGSTVAEIIKVGQKHGVRITSHG